MTLRAAAEITVIAGAAGAMLDALTDGGPPRVVLVEPEVLEDHERTLVALRALNHRLASYLHGRRATA